MGTQGTGMRKSTTYAKAVAINLDPNIYGTFAEIGAAQETARWFFRVGGAAGTIAKTMSAYDMTFSDAIYGTSKRYVSRDRLRTMLDHEYALLVSRLEPSRGSATCFFAFANTVAARSYQGNNESHGWLGMRFQREPGGVPHQIILHVRMLDRENLQQQEALGIVGVNLLHAAFYHADDPEHFVCMLLDDLSPDRIEADLLLFSGPGFVDVDNRLLNLLLLQKGLTRSIVISPDGEVLQAADHLYKRPVLLERGNFRPVTRVNLDMMHSARKAFTAIAHEKAGQAVEIMEITLSNLLNEDAVDTADFLARIELLGMLGKTVMISHYAEFHRLTAYLRVCTKEEIVIVLGAGLLRELFNEKYYANLEGGILESFGRLFKQGVVLYVYPTITEQGHITAENFPVEPHLEHLYNHLKSNGFIHAIPAEQSGTNAIASREVLSRLRAGDASWESFVAPEVARQIKARQYFGYRHTTSHEQ